MPYFFFFLGLHVWQGHTGLADTSKVVIVELIQRGGLLHPDLAFSVQVGTVIFKSIKVLRHSVY